MKKIFATLAVAICLLASGSVLAAVGDLPAALACHKSIMSFSEGRSEKLDFDEEVATPLLIADGGNLYVYTDKGAVFTKNTYKGKKVAIRVQDHGKLAQSEIEIGKTEGQYGNKGASIAAGTQALELNAVTDDGAMKALYAEINARLKTVTNSGGFKYKYGLIKPQVIAALEQCEKLESDEVKSNAVKSLTSFGVAHAKSTKPPGQAVSPTGKAR